MDTFHALLFSKLTLFMIVQTFFVSAIAGSLLSELESLVQEPLGKAQQILASSLPAQAVTFISLILVKCSYRLMMELLRPRSAVQGWMRTWIGPRLTPEERAQDYYGLNPLIWVLRPYSSPGPLKYHILLQDVVLMFTVLLVYSVLSPIANLFLLPAFCLLNLGYRHQMIYIYDPSNDTGGQLWQQLATYLLMLIAQVTVLGVLSLNESAGAPLMVPLLLATLFFARYMRRQHPRIALALPLFNCHKTDTDRCLQAQEAPYHFLHNTYKQKALLPLLDDAPPPDLEACSESPCPREGEAEREEGEGAGREGRVWGSQLLQLSGLGSSQRLSSRAGSVEASVGVVREASLGPPASAASSPAPLHPLHPPLPLLPPAARSLLLLSPEPPPAPRLLEGSNGPALASPQASVEVSTTHFAPFRPPPRTPRPRPHPGELAEQIFRGLDVVLFVRATIFIESEPKVYAYYEVVLLSSSSHHHPPRNRYSFCFNSRSR